MRLSLTGLFLYRSRVNLSLLTACTVCTSQVRYWHRSYAHSDPTCMTVAWPDGAGCAALPVVDVGFVDAVDAGVPWVEPAHVDGVLTLEERLS